MCLGNVSVWLKYEQQLNDWIYWLMYLHTERKDRKRNESANHFLVKYCKLYQKELEDAAKHSLQSEDSDDPAVGMECLAICLEGIRTTKGQTAFRSLRQKIDELQVVLDYMSAVQAGVVEHLPSQPLPYVTEKQKMVLEKCQELADD